MDKGDLKATWKIIFKGFLIVWLISIIFSPMGFVLTYKFGNTSFLVNFFSFLVNFFSSFCGGLFVVSNIKKGRMWSIVYLAFLLIFVDILLFYIWGKVKLTPETQFLNPFISEILTLIGCIIGGKIGSLEKIKLPL